MDLWQEMEFLEDAVAAIRDFEVGKEIEAKSEHEATNLKALFADVDLSTS